MAIPFLNKAGLLPRGIHTCRVDELRALATWTGEGHCKDRVMIETDEQLNQAWEALGDLYRALASYRSKILPANLRNYAIIAQGPQDQIRKIQAKIDEYLG